MSRQESALAAAKRADSFRPKQVVTLMFLDEPEIDTANMDDWCETAREDYPCLFKGRIHYGLNP